MKKRDFLKSLFALPVVAKVLMETKVVAAVAEPIIGAVVPSAALQAELYNSAIIYAYGTNAEYGDRNFPILWQRKTHEESEWYKKAMRKAELIHRQHYEKKMQIEGFSPSTNNKRITLKEYTKRINKA